MKETILIGYNGHGLVASELLVLSAFNLKYYCDLTIKENNPFGLKYMGPETELEPAFFSTHYFFIGIGDNLIRKKVGAFIQLKGGMTVNAVHPRAIISSTAVLGSLVMVAAGACINPMVTIGEGVICNTSSVIEHECRVGDYSHIAPGAILCGNVEVGQCSFIGANAIIKQGVKIGDNCIIGAGSVVLNNVGNGELIKGNPAR
jgi:sugar O-acyltransferase (sialic acid O-acetyltransferase NeuD family)